MAPDSPAKSGNLPLPAGLILAGGRSSRMGEDKTIMALDGRPMIAHVAARLAPQVSTLAINAPATFAAHAGLAVVPDTLADHQGPLAGVLAGLRHVTLPSTRLDGPSPTHMVTAPADGPFLPQDLVARLSAAAADARTIAVAASEGHLHPVYALWPLSLADDLETWLTDPDNRRIKAFFAHHPMVEVDFPSEQTPAGPRDPFFNVNTPEDLARARQFLERA